MQPFVVAIIVAVVVIGIVLLLVFFLWKPFQDGNEADKLNWEHSKPRDLPPAPQPQPPPTPQDAAAARVARARTIAAPFLTNDVDVNNHMVWVIQNKQLDGAAAQRWATERVSQRRKQATAAVAPPPPAIRVPSEQALFPHLHGDGAAAAAAAAAAGLSAANTGGAVPGGDDLPAGAIPLP